jgi:hypothetical protein
MQMPMIKRDRNYFRKEFKIRNVREAIIFKQERRSGTHFLPRESGIGIFVRETPPQAKKAA